MGKNQGVLWGVKTCSFVFVVVAYDILCGVFFCYCVWFQVHSRVSACPKAFFFLILIGLWIINSLSTPKFRY